jgi:hypothetical protein
MILSPKTCRLRQSSRPRARAADPEEQLVATRSAAVPSTPPIVPEVRP